ncbi:3-hydroxyacyl-CoA dehydrogenase family protein [Clostridium magnum]|uniref:L-gulonate 3-dehydrogenase n=1 Tax=Clostridium magnum DSM 2767 TaxID=1121326 RepID=A0A162QZM9_9CLOT|nr:3-hydroxyacyl-CoA dehydrogenase family protein [Clostridium magnum]KZL89199.1 L-carnitine dehydrogenase [Clostridium magnum DSM 2767]SHJ35339.1 3-hydroxybutyryl-CoA dehydrogenase [Clostridium magnum DSM 2767]
MKLDNVNHIAIIGTGMIGASMAVLFTGNGYKTTMYAINDAEIAKGKASYDTYYKDLIEKKLVTPGQAVKCAELLNFTQKYEDLADADFIFECVVERLNVKHAVYKEIEKHCKNFKAIASSTSAISVDNLAEGLIQKDKLSVAHPWNPPHLVPCVEVVKGKQTSDESIKFTKEVLESVGRQVSLMMKDAPGFIGNRLQHALYREAVYMVEQGIATPEDIDKTLKYSFIPRYTSIGLFEHFDYAGLDMIVSIDDYLFPTLSNADKTPDYIRNLHDSGNLGFKTGKGVYDWSKKDIEEFRHCASEPYIRFFNWSLPEDK